MLSQLRPGPARQPPCGRFSLDGECALGSRAYQGPPSERCGKTGCAGSDQSNKEATNVMAPTKDLYLGPDETLLVRKTSSTRMHVSSRADGALPASWAPRDFDEKRRTQGSDWPAVAHTMIGTARLSVFEVFAWKRCWPTAFQADVIPKPASGAARRTIFVFALLKACTGASATTALSGWPDSFEEGVPPPDTTKFPQRFRSDLQVI